LGYYIIFFSLRTIYLLPFLSFLDDDIQFHKTDYEFSINSLKNIEAKQAVYTWQPDMFYSLWDLGSRKSEQEDSDSKTIPVSMYIILFIVYLFIFLETNVNT